MAFLAKINSHRTLTRPIYVHTRCILFPVVVFILSGGKQPQNDNAVNINILFLVPRAFLISESSSSCHTLQQQQQLSADDKVGENK